MKNVPGATGRDPEAETELASTADDLTTVSRDVTLCDISSMQASACQRSLPRNDALLQKMMQLTQERRSVLTDRHVEVSDGYTH